MTRPTVPHRCYTEMDTPLGRLLIARNDDGLSGLWFEGQKYHPGPLALPRNDDDPLLRRAVETLQTYFAQNDAELDEPGSPRPFPPIAALDALPPLAPQGTPFQQAVWRALLEIPAGQTLSYGELATRVGRPSAVRAVAAAVGRNPLSVLIPCHRVIGADGQLTGYAGGLPRKQALLALERGGQRDLLDSAADHGKPRSARTGPASIAHQIADL